MSEVIYPLEMLDNQGAKHTYPLHTIALLPYFGAAHRDKNGYIFMPDGSGALIRFGSPKLDLLEHSSVGGISQRTIERNSLF